MNNQMTVIEKENAFKDVMKGYGKQIKALVGDTKAPSFLVSVMNTITNGNLIDCEPNSVMKAVMTATSLKLPIEQNFGFAYLIPYKNNRTGVIDCQFQLGYQGLRQLALRSGQVVKINAIPVNAGVVKSFNPLTEELEMDLDLLDEEQEAVGYLGYIKLANGFDKTIYVSRKKMDAHAKKYSQAYGYDLKKGYSASKWTTDFDAMALKTIYKKLCKFAPLSTEMQEAIKVDGTSIKDVTIDEKGVLIGAEPVLEITVDEEIKVNANTGEVIKIDETVKNVEGLTADEIFKL